MKLAGHHRGIVLLAGLLLSLHSLVPHVHHTAQSATTPSAAREMQAASATLFGFLQELFANTDLGEDHLEHFSVDQDLVPDLTQVVAPLAGLFGGTLPPHVHPALNAGRHHIVFRRHIPPAGMYPETLPTRGPPALI